MFFRYLVIIVILAAALAVPALAQSGAQKSLGTFGVWQAYSYKDGDQPVCYMVKAAHFPKSKKFKRGTAYLMITHRPAENSKDVVNYTSGYNFKPATDVAVHIGKNTFDLFTQKDTAWSRDPKTDHALAAAIRNSPNMKTTGTPAQTGMGTITDTLDLRGATAAYQAIGKACGIAVETPVKMTSTRKKKPAIKH